MFSASDARKKKSLSICLIMVLSALVPIAAPVSANPPPMSEPLTLEMNDNGTWIGVPHYSDPMMGGFLDAGTYELRFTSWDLTTNDDYTLDWMASVCSIVGDCTEPVDESRSWTAMGNTSTESWNLTLSVMDCDVAIDGTLRNDTSGDEFWANWEMFGPCGNTGDITLDIDLDGDGAAESVDGFDFDTITNITVGNYDASWNLTNLDSSGSYNLEWIVGSEQHEIWGDAQWNGTDPGTAVDFSFDVLPWTCDLWIEAFLFQENSTGYHEGIGVFIAIMSGPCDNPIVFSIWDDAAGEWIELEGSAAEPAGPYSDCFWSVNDTRWWCGEDHDGDGELDFNEWWFYCEMGSDMGWYCTDDFGQSPDHEFTENNTMLAPIVLDAGVYDVRANLTWLNDSTHYGVELHNLYPEYVEFNSTSDSHSILAELEVTPHDCESNFGATVWEDPNNNSWMHGPLMGVHQNYFGPCEEWTSPFTLFYDGIEWNDSMLMEFDDCTDMGGYWECEEEYDNDGDGTADGYDYYYFPYEDCEFSVDDAIWYCVAFMEQPDIGEGNHTMELLIEGLEENVSYTVDIKIEDCGTMGCDDDYVNHQFNATSDNETITFHVETDNFTCGLNISPEIHETVDGHHLGGDWFHFRGPCEQPPSPFTLYYDGIEYLEQYFYMDYDVCEEENDGWECWNSDWDYDGDGEPDHRNWHPECSEDATNSTWLCEAGTMQLLIDEGNHTMDVEIEDLNVGNDYMVKVGVHMGTQMEYGSEWIEINFTAASDVDQVTFHVETDNFTCGLNLDLELMADDGSGYMHQIGRDTFHFEGPCEQPPSPFTLYYDQTEWEEIHLIEEYDECSDESESGGSGIVHYNCWNDDWDSDGDGEPDYWNINWDCWENDIGTWECVMGMNWPNLDAGNHTMELVTEDVEGSYGPGEYELHIEYNVCDDMTGCDWDVFIASLTAGSANHTEAFFLETSNSTCDVSVGVSLLREETDESNNTWMHDVARDWFQFRGPCEQPPSNIDLTYELNGSMVDWEEEEDWLEFDDCTDTGGDYECEQSYDYDGDGTTDETHWFWFPHDACEFSVDDAIWYCIEYRIPTVAEGDLAMTFEIAELDANMEYRLEWDVFSSGMMSFDYQSHGENFTAASDEHSVDYAHWVDSSTCGLDIHASLHVGDDWDGDGIADGWKHIDSNHWGFSGPCDMSFPVEITLQIEDEGTWEDVEGVDLAMLFSEDDEGEGDEDEGSEIEMILGWMGYEVSDAGNYAMNLTLDGLEVGDNYTLILGLDNPNTGGSTFVCGNGDEIPFDYVNDEEEDCEDGADEQQYDDNGDPINWFDCNDGSEVWIYQVNDGNDDCPDGEDEAGGQYEQEIEFTATSDVMHEDFDIEFSDDTCILAVEAMVLGESEEDWNEGPMLGMFIAIIGGPMMGVDDDGDGIPDCLADMEGGPDDGPDGPDWTFEDFTTHEYYTADLVDVSESDESAVVFLDVWSELDPEIRIKIDHDFFNGDDILNDSEAMEFEQMLAEDGGWMNSGECLEEGEGPEGFWMNGVAPYCILAWMEISLTSSDPTEPAALLMAFELMFDLSSIGDISELTLSYEGDDPEEDVLTADSTLCGHADELTGYVIMSWTYDETEMGADECVELNAGEHIAYMEIVFGIDDVDSDGDGYSDNDDRFPDDPEEWADSDGDGWGDNGDAFPNDGSEWWDLDGDGVGDNGDAFPWDANETADSDGDGWGDNSDAFPNDGSEWSDYDGDGVGDNSDDDADGDGIPDNAEDSDGDGVYDDTDAFPFDANETTDTDGDGVGDNGDAFPNDANETTDTDGDGIGDNSDDDADGDGTPNDFDDFPLNSGESTDSDNDGVGDGEDAFPNDPNEYADNDADGIGDNADTDDDNDGTLDTQDAFPLDATEHTDTDGDGVGNNADAFPNDAQERTDADSDGVGDNSDPFPSNPNEWADSDGDGTGDNADAFPNDPSEIVDSDGDGVGNNADAFPYDETETADTDGDGIGDEADDDADGDGIPDEGPVDTGGDDGGILPGFSASLGLVSMLGAAVLVAGRRKD